MSNYNPPHRPRVALFADSFDEANGLATFCRQFAAFAPRERLPFFCVRHGAPTRTTFEHSATTLQLKRSIAAFPLDHDLRCDPLLNRFRRRAVAQLRAFDPDLVHITGPGDFGILGVWAAHSLGVPLVASWHTNLHEYAGKRLDRMLSRLPASGRRRAASAGERWSLNALLRFYRLPRFLLALNETTIQMLRERTGKPTYFMAHGVDTELFSPTRRDGRSKPFCIGYAGRLTPEKNVRFFAELERSLRAAGQTNFRLVLIGDGSEREWLRKNIPSAGLPGILRGEALASAVADMDVFVFPSRTDTFGLVLLEAMASGVPVVVSPETGARVEVRDGATGFLAPDSGAFTRGVLRLMENEPLRLDMSAAARRLACSKGWSGVFEQLYRTYEQGLAECGLTRPETARSVGQPE